MVTSRGVRTHFRLEISLPLSDARSRQRLIREMQIAAQKEARRRIVNPTRRKLPQSGRARTTGKNLRRSFAIRRPRRSRSRTYFTLLQFRFNYYLYFQVRDLRRPRSTNAWPEFRQLIVSETAIIGSNALQDAIRKVGL